MNEEDIEVIYSVEPIEPCWPFWGNLKSQGKSAYDKHGWNHSIITTSVLSADIFDRFYRVGGNALSMLKHRSITEMRSAAAEIQTAIDEWFEEYIEMETEARVQTLVNKGGWELGYLPDDSKGTPEEIRHLLDNWSGAWERLKLPSRDDFDDLFALSEYVEYNKLDPKELVYLGFCESEEHEIFALLAVMLICEAVNSKQIDSKNANSLSQVNSLAIATIEVVEALAYAEKLQLEEKVRRSITQKQPELLKKELTRLTSERARAAAKARHTENRSMKAEVFAWLDTNMGNKKMDEVAAEIAGKLVPMTFRTVRDWVGEWKRQQSLNSSK